MKNSKQQNTLPFGKENYRLMVTGVGLLVAGFIIMSLDQEEFGFGFLGITLGPLVLLAGFVVQYFAITKTPTKKTEQEQVPAKRK